jgi:hypothetical protein
MRFAMTGCGGQCVSHKVKMPSKSTESVYWQMLGQIAIIGSPWVTVKCERWRDHHNQDLDYWRVERPDSVVVIPIHEKSILLPKQEFRPGIGACTWDFPGGRVRDNVSHEETALESLNREMSINKCDIKKIERINRLGYPVDSSFSSQKLWGYKAYLSRDCDLGKINIGWKVPFRKEEVRLLLEKLTCLQCRSLLLDIILTNPL